jgi:hypothetical protein
VKPGERPDPIQPFQFSAKTFCLRKQNVDKVPFCVTSKAEGCRWGVLDRVQRRDANSAVGRFKRIEQFPGASDLKLRASGLRLPGALCAWTHDQL